MNNLTARSDALLPTTFRRCPPAALAAARRFHQTGEFAQLPVILYDIVGDYLEPGLTLRPFPADAGLRLTEDLGIDSLTLLEIVMLVEEVLQLSIDNAAVRSLRTLDDVHRILARSVAPATCAMPDSESQVSAASAGHTPRASRQKTV